MEFDDLLDFAREFCMDEDIVLNEVVYRSEVETGDRNRTIAERKELCINNSYV